jgi:hypothetical protein
MITASKDFTLTAGKIIPVSRRTVLLVSDAIYLLSMEYGTVYIFNLLVLLFVNFSE